ncbi:hypothetical protein [Cohnella hashimotonis]|uniref:Uncharacterized protein n=1 Tax=Cohnella hashimotonis TaxID=2826895 RepID=A0ABT6TCV9_9BACL|nr:hypothetical protein [Cohnella hashimotonis]MDI4643677.1 hypothetical protein [Cohnella hashimotonis]
MGKDTELLWSKYDDINDLIAELDDVLERLQRKDLSVLPEIAAMFAPTASLQEISLSNGWGEAFLYYSGRVDDLLLD